MRNVHENGTNCSTRRPQQQPAQRHVDGACITGADLREKHFPKFVPQFEASLLLLDGNVWLDGEHDEDIILNRYVYELALTRCYRSRVLWDQSAWSATTSWTWRFYRFLSTVCWTLGEGGQNK